LKIVVLGLGNPILTDDSVGIRIVKEFQKICDYESVYVSEAGIGGIRLIDNLMGYDVAIIVDAIQTGEKEPGHIFRFNKENMQETRHSSSTHDTDLVTALALAEKLQLFMPSEVIIFAVEAENVSSFCEDCTDKVDKAVPVCVDMIKKEIERILKL